MKFLTQLTCFITGFVLICGAAPLSGANPVVLKEINKPQYIVVDQDQFYISENETVYIYSLKDFSLVTSFGKDGEGPREFKLRKPVTIPLILDVQTDNLVITSMGKVSFFTKKGEFIKEYRISSNAINSTIQPIGKGFARTKYFGDAKGTHVAVLVYDQDMKPAFEVYRQPHFYQRGNKLNPLGRPLFFTSDVSVNHLIVDTGHGPIHVYDKEGKKKFTIQPNTEKLTISDPHKKEILGFYKNDPRMKRYWDRFKHIIQFPKHFPPVYVTIPANGKIYLLTFRRKDNKTECLIYDKTGAFIKNTFIPVKNISIMEPFPLIILNNKLYQLVENIDDEEWELHINPIE